MPTPKDLFIAEINTDPLALGYGGMTPAQALASLQQANRSVARDTVDAKSVLDAIVPAEYLALGADQKELVKLALAPGSVSFASPAARTLLRDSFPAGSTTRANLAALATRTVSRAAELGLGQEFLTEGAIEWARKRNG